jgi:NAD(P)-dependent dehydrogenase (short-subunit alcohol dehydrogenase family)
MDMSPAYSVSKGALNVLVAKYSSVYASQGILFMSICPGMVDTYEGPPSMSFPSTVSKDKKMGIANH